MRQFFNILLVLIFFTSVSFKVYAVSFQGVRVTEQGQTEAASQDDSIVTDENCCDREFKQGWAQEISPFEVRLRVNRIFSTGEDVPVPPVRPGRR